MLAARALWQRAEMKEDALEEPITVEVGLRVSDCVAPSLLRTPRLPLAVARGNVRRPLPSRRLQDTPIPRKTQVTCIHVAMIRAGHTEAHP